MRAAETSRWSRFGTTVCRSHGGAPGCMAGASSHRAGPGCRNTVDDSAKAEVAVEERRPLVEHDQSSVRALASGGEPRRRQDLPTSNRSTQLI